MGEHNAKITARIEEEHASLRRLMDSISQELKRVVSVDDFADWKIEFIWTLRDFQNELVKHFDLEEDGGFMDDVIRRAPHEKRRLEHLEAEHHSFAEELNGITTALKQINEQNMSDVSTVRERILALIADLHEHEASERDLIYTVYFQDLGVGD